MIKNIVISLHLQSGGIDSVRQRVCCYRGGFNVKSCAPFRFSFRLCEYIINKHDEHTRKNQLRNKIVASL